MRKGLFLLIIGTFMLDSARAQQAVDSMRIYYPFGYRYVLPDYRTNRRELERFIGSVQEAFRKDIIERVVVRSGTSPDGMSEANERLSARRADSLEAYVVRRTGLPSELIEKRSEGIAWGMLRYRVAQSDMPYRDEILQILDRTPVWIFDDRGRIIDGRKKQLMDLRGGVPYKYMVREIFPDLRSSIAVSLYLKQTGQPAPEPKRDTLPETPAAPDHEPKPAVRAPQPTVPAVPTVSAEKPFRPLLAVKTNLLYWATVMPDFNSYTFVPNLEAEWFFADRWSLAGTGNFAKWGYGGAKWFGISSWSLEPRWWLKGDGRFRWFYLGAYGQAGDYDVQDGSTPGSGYTGNLWGAGLSFGAAIPFSDRFGLEIGIRGGYRHAQVKGYSYEAPDYFLNVETADDHWGVTGIKASVYYRFGRGSNSSK